MSNFQFILLVAILALSVFLTRALPFLLFGKLKKVPKIIDYLSLMLPAAMMGLLVVYCYKDIDPTNIHSILPYILASVVCAILHLWKKNTILSIFVSTAFYMIIIHVI